MMLVRIFSILLLVSLLSAQGVYAAEVKLQHENLTLNANLEKAEGWPAGLTVLITHGTLYHNKSELNTALQELFLENGVSSLAINLGLGLNDRHGPYDCATPHTHKHEDAVSEIGGWVGWLKKQGVKQLALLGHSRGGNQTAWFAAEHDDPVIKYVILVAPQTWSPESAARDYEKNHGKPLAPVLNKASALAAADQSNTVMEHMDFIYCKDTTVSAAAVVSYYAPDPRKDTPYLLPKIKKPLLVFVGTEDQLFKGLDEKLVPLAAAGTIELEV
ncbi:MAG: alpha/beta fold hydrolase, partial [Gammaproteobacteria bacterium]|nr:alpha/beta fold hydrolase [Gammaproteobacteria bacterium]